MHLKIYQQTKLALGSDTTITIASDASDKTIDIFFAKLWLQIFEFEKQFSRFLPSSELSAFNASAGIKQHITPEFHDILVTAKKLWQQTDGLFNPFILPALQRAGYVGSAVTGHEGDEVGDYRNRAVVTPEKLKISSDWAQIPYGSAIDLGGCGKGYLADQIGALIDNTGHVSGHWISIGGDVYASGLNDELQPWHIDIQDARNMQNTTDLSITVPQAGIGVATSGTFTRPGQAGKIKHHIIDPITLQPVKTDIKLATVCAKTAVEADVLASCAVLLGSKNAPAYLLQRDITDFVLQFTNKGRIQTIVSGDSILKANKVQYA